MTEQERHAEIERLLARAIQASPKKVLCFRYSLDIWLKLETVFVDSFEHAQVELDRVLSEHPGCQRAWLVRGMCVSRGYLAGLSDVDVIATWRLYPKSDASRSGWIANNALYFRV